MGKVRVSLAHSEIWAPELVFQIFFLFTVPLDTRLLTVCMFI